MIQVDECIGMTVASKKLFNPKCSGTVVRADEHHIAEAMRDQFDPAQYVRTHEDVAQLAVGLDERQQFVPSDLDHLAVFARLDPHKAGAARQNVNLTRKHPGSIRGDDFARFSQWPERLDLTSGNHKESGAWLARIEQYLITLTRVSPAVSGEPRDFRRLKNRQQLFRTGPVV